MDSEPDRHDEPAPSGGQHPARLKVGIIGPGRVGTALGVALTRAGHEVTAVAAVSDASVRRARESFPAASITEPAGVIAAADLVLLTVPDDALPGLFADRESEPRQQGIVRGAHEIFELGDAGLAQYPQLRRLRRAAARQFDGDTDRRR